MGEALNRGREEPSGVNGPAAPQNVTAIALSATGIAVSWDSVSGAKEYSVYRRAASSDSYKREKTVSKPPYRDTVLLPGTVYYYRVSSRNSAGEEGPMSDSAFAKTPGEYYIATSVSPTGTGFISLNPRGDNGYAEGDTVTVTATAAKGYTFIGWSDTALGMEKAVTVTMDRNITLTARFRKSEEGDELIGDWLLAKRCLNGSTDSVENWLCADSVFGTVEEEKLFFTFTPVSEPDVNGGMVETYMENFGGFWIEGKVDLGYWWTANTNMYLYWGKDKKDWENEHTYDLSGNGDTLTITKTRSDSHTGDSLRYAFYKVSIAEFKKTAGTVHGQNPALTGTAWRLTEDATYYGRILFDFPYFYDGDFGSAKYTTPVADSTQRTIWYSESAKIFLLKEECGVSAEARKRAGDALPAYGRCENHTFTDTVTLDYELTGETLKLRPAGNTRWDVWARCNGDEDCGRLSKRRKLSANRPRQSLLGHRGAK
jgi:uncharacterized repeat protein (TIGR02543 family)